MLQNEGYKTAAAGKWQINDFRVIPDAMAQAGFDEYMMWTGFEEGNSPSANRYFEPYIHTGGPNGTPSSRTYNDAFGPDLFADFLVDFIRDNKNEPWFAYYPMVLPHGPTTATPADPSASGLINQTRAMVEYTDILLKRLLDTCLLYTSPSPRDS